MRVLVTNDDGIEAPGLAVLVRTLVDGGHDVVVGAPAHDYSGSGSSMGSVVDGVQVGYQPYRFGELPEVEAYAFQAPPAFAVLAFCTGSFGRPPELVVSGINDGFNTGRLIISSSTVGAVLVGSSLGLRGLAISTGFRPGSRFDTAAVVAAAAVRWLADEGTPGQMLNVNVPNLDVDQLAGVRPATLANRSLMGLTLERDDSRVVLHRFDNTEGLGSGTDASLVRDGFVAVTDLRGIAASGTEDTTAVDAIAGAVAGPSGP